MQRCQDRAQETLSASPSPKEIEKAQSLLAKCAADCAQVRRGRGGGGVVGLRSNAAACAAVECLLSHRRTPTYRSMRSRCRSWPRTSSSASRSSSRTAAAPHDSTACNKLPPSCMLHGTQRRMARRQPSALRQADAAALSVAALSSRSQSRVSQHPSSSSCHPFLFASGQQTCRSAGDGLWQVREEACEGAIPSTACRAEGAAAAGNPPPAHAARAPPPPSPPLPPPPPLSTPSFSALLAACLTPELDVIGPWHSLLSRSS